MNVLGELIASKRADLRLSKTKMAKRLGISSQLLGQYELGKHNPKLPFFQKWKLVFKEDLLERIPSNENYSLTDEVKNLMQEEEKLLDKNPDYKTKYILALETIIREKDRRIKELEEEKNKCDKK